MIMIPLAQVMHLNPRPPKGIDDAREVSFLAMASISEDGEITHQETRSFSDVKKGFTYFQRGDVLLAKITPCFENGKSALTEKLEHLIGFGSTEFHVLRAIPEKLNAKFLFHLVRSNRFRFLGKKSMKGAAGHKRVPADFLEKFEIPAWHLDDQARIAHLLDKVDGLITQRKQHLSQLDELLKSMFLEMFGDPILNPQGFPVRRLSEFYVNAKEGTKCGPFGSALKKEELVDSGVPVWNMDNIAPDGRMALPFRMWVTADKYANLAAYSVEDGDIIISRAGTVGKMCVAHMEGQPAIISTNLIRLRLNSELRALHFVSLMLYCKGRVGRLKTGPDGAFTHMNTGVLDSLEFPYPAIELQDQFGKIVEKIESAKSSYRQSLTNLETLYRALSQQAFKGELDLSNVRVPDFESTRKTLVMEQVEVESDEHLAIHLPDADYQLDTLESIDTRKALIAQWLDTYREQLGKKSFSAQHFMTTAQTRLMELYPDNDLELGAMDYEHIKDWVFNAIASGTLTQEFDDVGNSVQLKALQS